MEQDDKSSGECGDRVEYTVAMSRNDAEQFLSAFKEGKLAKLGIVDIKQAGQIASVPGGKRWAVVEDEKRLGPRDGPRAPERT